MEAKSLTKQYAGVPVVQSVDFEIIPGTVTSFIGPNGAGKSTVMHMISRLLPHEEGEIIFGGAALHTWKSDELSKKLAILTQQNNINMKLTIRELVAFGRFPYCKGRLTDDDWNFVEKAISYMELEAIQNKYIDELSGGQRQRAYIAMVIAQDTEYILLDEPTNNLDIYHAGNMMEIVRKLCDDLGKTVLLVLHDINYASFYSDYICAMKDGKIIKYGTADEVLQEKIIKDIYGVDCCILNHNGKKLCIYY